MSEDSTASILEHIQVVRDFLGLVQAELGERARLHDRSKLSVKEKSSFDEYSPKLKNSPYGSEEYEGLLAKMKPALENHYARNRHHPEHHGGIGDMNLIDLIEMMVDWYAATKRHNDGDIRVSIETNQMRFGYSDELKGILHKTADWLEAIDRAPSFKDPETMAVQFCACEVPKPEEDSCRVCGFFLPPTVSI